MDKIDKEIEMSAEEIVGRLIKGSKEIDRMRKEVEVLVTTVFGFIKRDIPCYFKAVEITSERCKWKIENWGETGEFGKMYFEVSCMIKYLSGWKSGYSLRKHTPFHSEDVKAVHECLPDFIRGVRESFPKLNESWQYLLQAAEK